MRSRYNEDGSLEDPRALYPGRSCADCGGLPCVCDSACHLCWKPLEACTCDAECAARLVGAQGIGACDDEPEPTVTCAICATVSDLTAAVDLGWIPSFYDGQREIDTPTCPDCAAHWLVLDADGERVLRVRIPGLYIGWCCGKPLAECECRATAQKAVA